MKYEKPVLVTDQVLADLDALCAFEPSHQPYEIAVIRALLKGRPSIPQVACFDTSFHRTMPRIAQIYALPRKYREGNLRHWGYHGISYDYISRQLPRYAPDARRVIVAHLGGGCSMCAMLDGKSVETSMGFSAIEGLPMSTRAGEIDAGILLHLMKADRMDPAAVESLLYQQSGLLGISGVSGDMRELQGSPRQKRPRRSTISSTTSSSSSALTQRCLADSIHSFSPLGSGKTRSLVRAKVCEKLGWLRVKLDPAENDRNGLRISGAGSAVGVFVIPTNEELMIAQHTLMLVAH